MKTPIRFMEKAFYSTHCSAPYNGDIKKSYKENKNEVSYKYQLFKKKQSLHVKTNGYFISLNTFTKLTHGSSPLVFKMFTSTLAHPKLKIAQCGQG